MLFRSLTNPNAYPALFSTANASNYLAIGPIKLYFYNGVITPQLSWDYAVDTDWHYYTFIQNGSSITLYVDGNSLGTQTYGGLNSMATLGLSINGAIDDVRVYDCILDISQITALYNSNNGTEDDCPPL